MILVTGATGNTGRPLLDALLAAGARVRATTRDPATALLPKGLEVVAADPERPATLLAALDGADALFLNSAATGEATGALLEEAGRRGVRVVLLSSLSVDDEAEEQADPLSRRHAAVESLADRAGQTHGRAPVVLRPGMFALNTLAQWAGQVRAGDVVRGPYAAAPAAPVHERDLACRALLDASTPAERLKLTGPESLTRSEMVTRLGEVLGRPLTYQEVAPEAALSAMVARGMPADRARAALALQARRVGRPAELGDAVRAVLGRPALPYRRWAADHAGDFGGRA